MGLQKIVLLCVILVAFGASVWYFTQNNFSDADEHQQSEQSVERERTPEDGAFTGYGSVVELLERGESVVCEYRMEEDGDVTEGVVYVDGAGGRYSMQGTHTNESVDDSESFAAIVDGEVMYWWGAGMGDTSGIRMSVPEDQETIAAPEEFSQQTALSSDQDVAYDCDRWDVEASVFVPPSDVEFTDMDQMMEEMMQNMPEGIEMPEGAAPSP